MTSLKPLSQVTCWAVSSDHWEINYFPPLSQPGRSLCHLSFDPISPYLFLPPSLRFVSRDIFLKPQSCLEPFLLKAFPA